MATRRAKTAPSPPARPAPTRRRARGGGAGDDGEEWVAGHHPLPLYVQQDEGSFRPELAAWISPRGVLAASPAHPDEVDAALLGLWRQAAEQPLVGAPGRPAAVRVSDPRLALAIGKALGPDVVVRVAPTPELEALAAHFVNHLDEEDPAPERAPWVDDGLDEGLVRGFFAAAAALYRAAPWAAVPGEGSLLAVDAPAFALEGACLSIIGGAGEELGFLLFDSVAGFETMRQAGLRHYEEGAPLTGPGTSIFSVSFEPGAALPESTLAAVARRGLPVADAQAYPLLLLIDPDNVSRPPTDDDVRRAWALCEALTRLIADHPRRLASERGAPLRQTYALESLPGRPALTLTLPHPDDASAAGDATKPAATKQATRAAKPAAKRAAKQAGLATKRAAEPAAKQAATKRAAKPTTKQAATKRAAEPATKQTATKRAATKQATRATVAAKGAKGTKGAKPAKAAKTAKGTKSAKPAKGRKPAPR